MAEKKKKATKKTTVRKVTKKTPAKAPARKSTKKTARPSKATAAKKKKKTRAKTNAKAKAKTKTPKAKSAGKARTKATASPLAVGMTAPDFSLESDNAGKQSLQQYRGKKRVLLYFYPKDNTPGCTAQACTFEDHTRRYEELGTVVLGVSTDDASSHAKFRSKYKLNFPLLIDANHQLADKYGVWVEKNMYGKKSMGVRRSTFLIDRDGKIAAIWPKVRVEGHSDDVLNVLRQMR